MFQEKIKIISNRKICNGYFKMVLGRSQIAQLVLPGQFVNVKISGDYEPLLRRPFGIHRVRGLQIEILYEVVGKATEILSRKKSGEYLDVLGPLGNGFPLHITHNTLHILVAGGIGVAPLIFLVEKLAKVKSQKSKVKNLVLLGAKTKSKILCAKEFRQSGCDVKIATDDGSRGFKGKVTDLLMHLLATIDYRPSTIYACGPHPMLKEIAKIANRFKIKAYGLLEEHMACGIGVCLGCVVKTKSGYQTVCKDGPVFDLSQIIWG